MDELGCVRRSVAAQSAAWQASILLPIASGDHGHGIQSEKLKEIWVQWGPDAVPESDRVNYSELLAPIPRRSRRGRMVPHGVVAVSNKDGGALNAEHLRRVEAVTRLVGAILDFGEAMPGCTSTAVRDGLSELRQRLQEFVAADKAGARIPEALLNLACRVLCNKFNVDIAYFLLRDSAGGGLRPVGVHATDALCNLYLKGGFEGVDGADLLWKARDTKAIKGRAAEYEDVVYRLVTRALRGHLSPVTFGPNQRVFQTLESVYLSPLTADVQAPQILVNQPERRGLGLRALYGIPYFSSLHPRPLGVLWLGWREPKKADRAAIDSFLEVALPLIGAIHFILPTVRKR